MTQEKTHHITILIPVSEFRKIKPISYSYKLNNCYSLSFCHAWTHAASQRWQTYAQWLLHTVGLHSRLGLEALSPITQCFAM